MLRIQPVIDEAELANVPRMQSNASIEQDTTSTIRLPPPTIASHIAPFAPIRWRHSSGTSGLFCRSLCSSTLPSSLRS